VQPAVYRYFGKYGVAKTVYFATQDFTDVDDLYIGTAFAAADTKISKDGGAVATSTNVPAQITASQPHFSLAVTATEMQADEVFITIRDQTEAEVFEPVVIHITNNLTLGKIDVDATQYGGNTTGVSFTGIGTGSGLAVTGGATGNGLLATGTSTGARGIKVVNATGDLYLSNLFDQQLPAEATVAFAATDSIGKVLGRIVRRFLNKVTQSTTAQVVYADDGTTAVETMAVSDSGVLQSKGKAS
jgi:hypothetical protein